jgi:predicted RNA-binding protein YlqC (UPF0109 family)
MENTEMTDRLRDLLTQIAKQLVDNPDRVEVAANVVMVNKKRTLN